MMSPSRPEAPAPGLRGKRQTRREEGLALAAWPPGSLVPALPVWGVMWGPWGLPGRAPGSAAHRLCDWPGY